MNDKNGFILSTSISIRRRGDPEYYDKKWHIALILYCIDISLVSQISHSAFGIKRKFHWLVVTAGTVYCSEKLDSPATCITCNRGSLFFLRPSR